MTTQLLKSSNSQLETLLKNNDTSNPKVKQIIRRMKIVVYSIGNLHDEPTELLIQARSFSELNLFSTLVTRNDKEFNLAIENVRFFYENGLNLPESQNHFQIKAIHLLLLLSTHRNEQFYSKLENLTVDQLSNPLINYVFKINDAIEQGNYRRVFTLKKGNPLVYFSPFLDKIEETVRIEIAKSAQKAYTVISLKDALQVFQVENEDQLKKFVSRYTESQEDNPITWSIEDGKIYFKRVNRNKVKFNSEDLIKTCLYYATEIEKIA